MAEEYYNSGQVVSVLNDSTHHFTFETGSINNHTAIYAPINNPEISTYFKKHPEILDGKFTIGQVDGHDVLMVSELDGDRPIARTDLRELLNHLGIKIEESLNAAGLHNSRSRSVLLSAEIAANGMMNKVQTGRAAEVAGVISDIAPVALRAKTVTALG